MSYHMCIISCHTVSYRIIAYHIVSYHIVSCIIPYHIGSYCMNFIGVVSYHIVSHRIQMDGLNILTDPMFSERASASQLVGPRRFAPPAISISDLPPLDVVLLSHNHYDHLDTGSVRAIGDGPLWVVPSGLKG